MRSAPFFEPGPSGGVPGPSLAGKRQLASPEDSLDKVVAVLGRTYEGIWDLSVGGRTENGHEMVFALVSGADFRCILHHFSSLTSLKRSWGQVWPENGPKPKLKFRF